MSRRRGSRATEEGEERDRHGRVGEERRLGGGESRSGTGYRGGTWPADFCGGGTCRYLPPRRSSLVGG
ncbi:hypothetical protein EMPG_16397 [Blastomyces silverae]|uniref:Uncharacterized protein n=1 Tax=Blastomyces silverae TaxID=2060906 RepID=A0A0H1BAM4_9EURO|nr:hypothetical protein EMPG_16397 [Blastomyces silverae]